MPSSQSPLEPPSGDPERAERSGDDTRDEERRGEREDIEFSSGELDPPRASLPEVADGRERRLDPRHLRFMRIVGQIQTAIIAVILAFPATAVTVMARTDWGFDVPGWLGTAIPAGWLAFVVALAVFHHRWPAVVCRHVSYWVTERGIDIHRGVLWRSEISVPRTRVQHTDVTQGPIERQLGLASLVVHTAGTQHATVSLPGLARDTAQAIRDYLAEAAGHDDAV